MLTPREEAVKAILLEELRRDPLRIATGLSYAERKYLQQDLEVEFVEDELRRTVRLKRWVPWIWGGATIAVLTLVTFSLDASLGPTHWFVLELIALAGILNGLMHYRMLSKRMLIYRALRVLCMEDAGRAAREATEAVGQVRPRLAATPAGASADH